MFEKCFGGVAGYDAIHLQKDIPAGIIVGIVALPLVMAFARLAGVPPEKRPFTVIRVFPFLVNPMSRMLGQLGQWSPSCHGSSFIWVLKIYSSPVFLASLVLDTMEVLESKGRLSLMRKENVLARTKPVLHYVISRMNMGGSAKWPGFFFRERGDLDYRRVEQFSKQHQNIVE